MKWILTSLMAVGLILSAATIQAAEDDSSSSGSGGNAIPEGTPGLLGNFGGFDNFTVAGWNLAGSSLGIGGEFVVMPKLHARALLDFDMSSGNREVTNKTGTTSTTEEDPLESRTGLGIAVGATYDLMQAAAVPYVGGLIHFSSYSTEDVDENTPNPDDTTTNSSGQTNFGVTLLGGARVFVTDYITIFGEYTVGFGIESSNQETVVEPDGGDTSTTTISESRTNIGFGTNYGGRVGIGVYFF